MCQLTTSTISVDINLLILNNFTLYPKIRTHKTNSLMHKGTMQNDIYRHYKLY